MGLALPTSAQYPYYPPFQPYPAQLTTNPYYNPVVSGQPSTYAGGYVDPYTGRFTAVTQSVENHASAYSPGRNYAISGTERGVSQYVMKPNGQWVLMQGQTYVGADGMQHGTVNESYRDGDVIYNNVRTFSGSPRPAATRPGAPR
jgi:hypothetical protein